MFVLNEPDWVIRKIDSPGANSKVYLTFDDGPSHDLTPKVLDVLKTYGATATFFVIGNKAANEIDLINRMLIEGHSVQSHSVDHDYRNYFKSKLKLKAWMQNSISHLASVTHKKVFAFRPPAGILTPPLLKVAKDLNLPLVLWNQRFFDSLQQLTISKVSERISNIRAGDIILLHDHQKKNNGESFLLAFEYLVQELQNKKFKLCSIAESDVLNRSGSSSAPGS